MSMSEQEHDAMVTKALDAIPGYPFLPCPICKGVEGCNHSVPERAEAYQTRQTLFSGPHDHDHVVKTGDVNNMDVVGTVCPTHETVLIDGLCAPCGGKSERNRRVAARWDELSAAGKHGHYETLFQIVREEVEPLESEIEELIRGMTELAERATARMDDAGEQIARFKALIGLIETTLLRDSAAKDQAGNIDKRNFVGRAILLCREAS
jgi:hypothetical protein